MARNIQPIAKRCKTLGISPATLGYAKKTTNRTPKGQMHRRKQSEYGIQLQEKQKVRFIYGVMERQFRNYFEMAQNRSGQTGENLLSILESRLDNVAYRLGFGTTRAMARQMVNHGHILVDGKKVDIASYLVKPGQVVSVREKSREIPVLKELREQGPAGPVAKWLELDAENLTGRVIAAPQRDDIDFDVEEHLIVEFYSR